MIILNISIMKKRFLIILILSLLLFTYYIVDRKVFMKERVLRYHLWESNDLNRDIRGDFITTQFVTFKKDTMIFNYPEGIKDTLILKYQYFNTMKIFDPRTGKTGKYTMKGANWVNFIDF